MTHVVMGETRRERSMKRVVAGICQGGKEKGIGE